MDLMKSGLGLLLCFAALAAPAAEKLAVVDAFFEEPDGRITRSFVLPAGDTLYFGFKIAGFRPDDRQRVRLTYTVDCLDPQGVPLVESYTDKVDARLSPQDEHWKPKVAWSVVVPVYAPSGAYKILVRVDDEIAKGEARYETLFNVRGETLASEEKLAVRSFEFADAEGGAARPDNVFRPGSTLWARFKLVGFRVIPAKEYWVENDLVVLDSTGRVLLSRPNAAVEKHKQFYPPRVLSTTFDLQLQPGLKPGEYTIRLDARDRLGEQSVRHETKFRVEP